MSASTSPTDPPQAWSSYMSSLYLSRDPPFLGSVADNVIEEKARQALKGHEDAFMYVYGSAGTGTTYAANLQAFQKWRIVPRMLVDVTVRNLETTIFGVKYRSPLFIAPIGIQGTVHADGELATARAAVNVGVPMIMSTAATRTIEEVAAANGQGQRWYQLYWPRTPDVTLSILGRAKKNGFTALVISLDVMTLGWRPDDLQTAYLPFLHGVGSQVGASDPVFMKSLGLEPEVNEHPEFPYDAKKIDKKILEGDPAAKRNANIGQSFLEETNSGLFRTWADVKFLRDNWDGPLILKGIQSALDAEKAIAAGVDGIVVSNHGGRQVDGMLPSLYALDTICQSPKIQEAQKSGKLTILFDSGIRTGSDIIKALALGAQGILLGRPYIYGLAAGGQEGVEQVLRTILADLEISMGLSGYKNISEFQGKREAIITKVDL